jgi:small-conductance mechanosensitive channel
MAIDQEFKAHGIDFAVPQIKLQLPEGVSSN